MNVGFIVFVIFTVISVISSISENVKKEKSKQAKFNKKVKSTREQVETKSLMKQVQKSFGMLENDLKDLKNNPEKKLKEIERRIDSGSKMKQSVPKQSKVTELKKDKPSLERSAQKKIEAFEDKIQSKENQSLEQQIEKIKADTHLSPRQKMNRINMIRMEADIDNAASVVEFTPESTLKGIIFSEILSPPKAKR